MWQTRRDFLKTGALSGAALVVSCLVVSGFPRADAAVMDPPISWSLSPGKARHRIDGLTKVTGQRIYARDFHPIDLPAWPAEYRHALVLLTTFVDHVFDGLDLGVLPKELRPSVVITAEDLARDGIGIAKEDYPAGAYLVPRGSRPTYLGQALAILLFDSREAFQNARMTLVFQRKGVRVGAAAPVPPSSYFEPETSIIHVTGRDGGQQFAQTLGGPVHPSKPGARNAEAMRYVNALTKKLETADWDVYRQTYTTQVADPMFMEPESGLAWLDRADKTLRLLIGTQSPGYDVNSSRALFAGDGCAIDVDTVHLYAAYPGGGFGGRDTSILCLYLALAAAYSDRPVRIEHDRFQQFHSGVKRHASTIELTLAVDRASGGFQAIRNHTFLNGGGRINVSSYVADVAGLTGGGPYRFPLADIWSRARHTRSLVGGSMRGFGSYQSAFAIESLIDEVAERRGVDAIALRRQNVLASNEPIVTGAPKAPPDLHRMCEMAQTHALWAKRDALRKRHSDAEWSFGTGFALAMKNYGSGADAVMSQVAVTPEGGVVVTTNSIDMGTGLATTMALAPAGALGRNANEINTGQTAPFENLRLVEGFEEQPYNPRWVPIIWNSTKASAGSSRWIHATEQASTVLFEASILPAARALWGAGAAHLKAQDVAWAEGQLASGSFEPIPFATLAREIHARKLAYSAMVHAFFSGRWIEGDYTVDGVTQRWPIAALAVQRGGSTTYELVDRRNPALFTVESMWEKDGQTFAAAAALVAVAVSRRTGAVRVRRGVHYLAPGKVLQRDLVEGQMEGGWAMGVGHALLEDLPAFEDGGVTGQWNLNRYHVALSGDCAIHAVEKVILPPAPGDPARGIAENCFTPVAPAIANAVAHATGKRFRNLPITPDKVRAVWS